MAQSASLIARSRHWLNGTVAKAGYAVVKAATGGATVPDGERFANRPAVRRTEADESASWDELTGRVVSNDPRELYWGVLPNKIQPKQALWMVRAAMGGDLWQFWRLTENMLNTWPKLAMAQHQLREAVSYVRYAVHPYCEDDQEPTDSAIERQRLVQAAMNRMTPDPFNDEKARCGMIYNFTDAVLRGIALEEIIWQDPQRVTGGQWQRLPKATAWTHPRHFTFNQAGSLVVFSSASTLNIGDYRRFGKGIGEVPNPNKMICSQFMSRSGSSLVNGFAMQLVWWWCARQYGLDFILKMAQNFGNPWVNVTYKPGMSQQERNDLSVEILKGIGNRALLHVEGSTLDLEPPQNLGTDNPQRWIIEESDREVLYLFLGQTGSTISAAGKLGDEETHNTVKQERVAGVAGWVASSPLEQFARAVLMVNYGDCDECPTLAPDFTKPLDATQVGSLASSITTSRLPVVAAEHYRKIGYKVPRPGDEVIQGGELKIQGEPLTDDEKQEKEFDAQVQMQKASLQMQAPGQKVLKAKAREVQALLADASPEDRAEVMELVTAAERAAHPNGELTALKLKLETLRGRKL